MAPATGDGNREAIRCGHFRRGRRRDSSMVPEAYDTTKCGTVANEA
jgi:hypothetical protein